VTTLVFFQGCDEVEKPNPVVKPAPEDPKPDPKPIPGAELNDALTELLTLHNAERGQRSIKSLKVDSKLNVAAHKHAVWMAKFGTLSHIGENGSSHWRRMVNEGFKLTSAGENIAMGYSTPKSVFQGWMNSQGHRNNIYGRGWTHIGLGVAYRGNRPYWCAVFAKSSEVMKTQQSDMDMDEMQTPEPIEGGDHEEASKTKDSSTNTGEGS
jgi:uncharacterized protein YkwD